MQTHENTQVVHDVGGSHFMTFRQMIFDLMRSFFIEFQKTNWKNQCGNDCVLISNCVKISYGHSLRLYASSCSSPAHGHVQPCSLLTQGNHFPTQTFSDASHLHSCQFVRTAYSHRCCFMENLQYLPDKRKFPASGFPGGSEVPTRG